MSTKDMMETIDVINIQLKENKELVNNYVGDDNYILTICELSKALIEIKQMYKEMLLYEYGIYYKG